MYNFETDRRNIPDYPMPEGHADLVCRRYLYGQEFIAAIRYKEKGADVESLMDQLKAALDQKIAEYSL